MNKDGFETEAWVYFGHEDGECSYEANQIEPGYNVYISAYDEPVCDGYRGKIGYEEQMAEKIYCKLFVYFNHGQEKFFVDKDGEEDSTEIMWAKVLKVINK